MANGKWMGALEISERIGKPERTIQRWLRERRDIFPNARKDGPFSNSSWVTHENDVIAYEKLYSEEYWDVKED